MSANAPNRDEAVEPKFIDIFEVPATTQRKMPPPEVNTEALEPESDAVTTPGTEGAASQTRPEEPVDNEGRRNVDRARERKLQRQRRMKQAWKKLVDSFDEVFYNSDDNEDDGRQDHYYPPRSPRGSVDDRYRGIPPRRGIDDRYSPPTRGYPPYNAAYDRDIIVSRSRSRTPPPGIDRTDTAPIEPVVEQPAPPPPPISYVTELYNYSEASRRGEFQEAQLRNTFEKDRPADIFHARNAEQTVVQGLVFKLVSMYAIPENRRSRAGRRNRYEEASEDDIGDDYLRHAEQKLGVLAELGTYMTIHSQAVLKALRSIIVIHPDLSRLAETVTLPEPFCVIVQYKNEIDKYIAALPALPEPEPAPAQELTPALIPGPETATNGQDTTADTAASELSPVPAVPAELTDEQQQRHDLQILMDYIFSNDSGRDFGRKYGAEIALHAQKKCTFELAWMLFRPGSYVYSWEGDSLNCFIVDSFELEGLFAKRTRAGQAEVRPRNRLRGQEFGFSRVPESIIVKMCYLEFDGEYIGRRPKRVVISAFEGEKAINALPVFPAKYNTLPETRAKLIARGKAYLELTKRTYAEYDGETLSIPARSVKSRVMIDSRTFYNDRDSGMTKAPKLRVPKEEGAISSDSSHSGKSDDSTTPYRARRSMRDHRRKIRDLKRRPNRNASLTTEYDILDPEEGPFADEVYMLCTARVYGFILKERVWDLLDVAYVSKPKFQDDMIDDLVLKEEAKTLVQALSNSHAVAAGTDLYLTSNGGPGAAPTRWSADFVQNKGEGRIFLLHGKPGVGKTTTAECVAEQSRSPLLSITCGDLGIYPDEVEKNLMKWLKLATLWKAVLLLDEADVYLESRVSGDLQRNSLVSIFLRALEYYQGLLFLTTNRIGTFDEALISRIHVVLHYPDFTDAQRGKIWQTSFRKLQDERPDVIIDMSVLSYVEHEDLKKLKWNGREIRNAFNTIFALAEFDAEKKRRAKMGEEGKKVVVRLERSHLEQVVEMSAKFKEYMRRTRGMDESKFAHVSRVRDGDQVPGVIPDHRNATRGHRG